MKKNDNFTYFNMLIPCIWLQVINKVKVTHQGEGHMKVKTKYLHHFKFYVACTLCKRVVCIQLNAFLYVFMSPTHGTWLFVDFNLFEVLDLLVQF